MRAAFLLPSNVAGGAERVMTSLANALSNENIEIYFIIFDIDSSFYELHSKVRIIHLDVNSEGKKGIKKYLLFPQYFHRLYHILKKIQPDIVLSFLYITNIVGIIVCNILKVPIVISERNDPRQISNFKIKVMDTFYKRVNGFVSQSDSMRKYTYERYGIENGVVIPNPLTKEQVASYSSDKLPVLISVGRLAPQKNFKLLIEAFSECSELINQYSLYIYGEGYLRSDLEGLIQERGLENRIFLPGVEKDIIKKRNNSLLFILPSNYEGYPNVLIEALANGIPVIASNVASGTVDDIVKEGINGYKFAVGNKEELKMKIIEALSDYEKLTEMSKTALRIYDDLAIEKIAHQWKDYLEYISQMKHQTEKSTWPEK